MHKIFDPDNVFWRWFGRIADMFALSCLWLLCCLPIITIVPASIALYDSIARCVRGPDGDTYRRFFRTLKAELLRGIGMTLLWGLLAFILIIGYNFLRQMAEQSQGFAIYAVAFTVSMLIPIAVVCWLIPIESRFANSFLGVHKTAVYFTFAHLPTTVAITVALILCGLVISYFPFMALVLPAVMVCLQSWFIERVFAKYMPAEDEPTAK